MPYAPLRYFKQLVKGAVEPRGRDPRGDALSLALWEQYAAGKHAWWRFANALTRTPGKNGAAGPPLVQECRASEFFRTHIITNLLPFWRRHAIGDPSGSFTLHLDQRGRPYQPDAERASGFQARMVYAFSLGYDAGGVAEDLAVAKRGIQFLLATFWDPDYGGWYSYALPDGTIQRLHKATPYQATVAIALLEYYRVSQDATVLPYISETVRLLEAHAWDSDQLGYAERCERAWGPLTPRKTLCVQLWLLGVHLALHRVLGSNDSIPRLIQLADVMLARMLDRKHRCLVEICYDNWLYSPVANRDQIEVGHQLKAARLLLDVFRITRQERFRSSAGALIDFSLRYGWDRVHGGFYQHLFRNGMLASDHKLWWPECEALPALLSLHVESGDPVLLDYFDRQAAFCFAHFVDQRYGEWFTSCYRDGSVYDSRKGGDSKAALHTVEASWLTMRLLQTLTP